MIEQMNFWCNAYFAKIILYTNLKVNSVSEIHITYKMKFFSVFPYMMQCMQYHLIMHYFSPKYR